MEWLIFSLNYNVEGSLFKFWCLNKAVESFTFKGFLSCERMHGSISKSHLEIPLALNLLNYHNSSLFLHKLRLILLFSNTWLSSHNKRNSNKNSLPLPMWSASMSTSKTHTQNIPFHVVYYSYLITFPIK